MKNLFYFAMVVVLFATITFNICFAYSHIDCVGCATMAFFAMTTITSVATAMGFRHLYKWYENKKKKC